MYMKERSDCSVAGCDRPAKSGASSWCQGHYQRAYRSKDNNPGPASFRRAPKSPAATCSQPDCERDSAARGWCPAHYQRWYDGRLMTSPIRPSRKPLVNPEPCKIEGCNLPEAVRGWCRGHYMRAWTHGDPGPAELKRYGLVTVCSAEGCESPHRTGGYCDTHYRRAKRGLSPNSLTFLTPPRRAEPDNYAAIHRRLTANRGAASEHTCGCGKPTRQWAYQHNDPSQRFSPSGMPYSLNIQACYLPMCLSCHSRLDRDLDRRAEAMRSAS